MAHRSSFLRAAGYAAFAIIPTLIASGLALWLFFAGAGGIFGDLNDLLTAVCLLLLALPVVAITALTSGSVGSWFAVVSWLAVAGIGVAGAGQVLLVLRAISLETSFVTGGVGILPVLAWAVALAIVALRTSELPDRLGWATIALLATIVAASLGSAVLPAIGILAVSTVLLVALSGWLIVLGRTCLEARTDAVSAIYAPRATSPSA